MKDLSDKTLIRWSKDAARQMEVHEFKRAAMAVRELVRRYELAITITEQIFQSRSQ